MLLLSVTVNAAANTEIKVPSEPQDGGVLTISLSASAKRLDPVEYTSVYEGEIIGNVIDTLVSYKMDLSKIVPNLAKSWTISDDKKEYTFKLRDDVYFQSGKYQDGRKLVAKDVKYSLERSHELSAMKRLDMIDHVEVINDYEVVVYFPKPNAILLTSLTDVGNGIVPKEEVEGWGEDFGKTKDFLFAQNVS